ncbi:hypothetical protein DFH06DRAFT_1258701 [Mycena polygramma]|nr:hypothetical protein DFH06DRAFT_1258701 [Mycena polygramma]
MSNNSAQENSNRRRLIVLAFVFLVALASSSILWSGKPQKLDNEPLSFRVAFGDEVALRVITAKRYGLGEDGDEEWSKILPSGGHLVHITEDVSGVPEAHTVTLFHQLKCLDIIRTQYKSLPSEPISPHTRHCMNYLRQTLLCQPNLRLESVEDEFGLSDRNFYDTVCRDWTAVYSEAERNQAEFKNWKDGGE